MFDMMENRTSLHLKNVSVTAQNQESRDSLPQTILKQQNTKKKTIPANNTTKLQG